MAKIAEFEKVTVAEYLEQVKVDVAKAQQTAWMAWVTVPANYTRYNTAQYQYGGNSIYHEVVDAVPQGDIYYNHLVATFPKLAAEVRKHGNVNPQNAKKVDRFLAWVKENWGDGPEPRRERTVKVMTWKSPIVRYEHPDAPGWVVVELKEQTDLDQWARSMGHCGNTKNHGVQVGIRHFLTVLDPSGKCHVNIDCKDEEWLNKPHPQATMMYDSQRETRKADFPDPVDIDGHIAVVLGADARYTAAYDEKAQNIGGRYAPIIKGWYDANRVAKGTKSLITTPAPIAYVPRRDQYGRFV